jgi:lipid A 3-O-deacylase
MKTLHCLAIATLLPISADAQDRWGGFLPDYGDGYLTFYFDNDLFSGSDKDYTNGARLSWISGNRPVEELGDVQRYLRLLIGDASSPALFQRLSGFSDAAGISYNYGMAITQLMYTPEDSVPTAPILNQRPYAGVLLAGFSLHAMDESVLNTVSLNLGMVGPHAYAEETQDFIHSLRDIEKFNGWKNQVPDEFLVNIRLTQKRRLSLIDYANGIFAIDGFSETALALGNFRTEAIVGGLIRIGFNLPVEFSDPRLSPDAYSHKLFQSDRVQNSFWSLYTIFGVRGSAVGHDVTLDGPVFRGGFDTGVDREPFVAEAYAGFGVRLSDWELSYVHTYRSREFDHQHGNPSFGSIAIRKSF